MDYSKLIGSKLILKDGSVCRLIGITNLKLKVIVNGYDSVTTIHPDNVLKVASRPNYSAFEPVFIRILELESGLSLDDVRLNKDTRLSEYTEFRFLHILYRYDIMKLSNKEAARYYKKDHATCIYARKKLSEWYKTNRSFRTKYSGTIDFILEKNPDAFEYDGKC